MSIRPTISIVIPVYNADKFLNQTISSVLKQSYLYIELILVDDGSTDNSLEICRKYAEQDSRVKVIEKENGGANPARGKGVENATGGYVYFMDADDTIGVQEIEILYKEIGDADILMSGSRFEFRLNQLEYVKALINHQIPLRLCGHMYRRSILEPSFFATPREIRMGEDMLSNLMIAQNVRLFKSIKYSQYHIDGSNMNSVSRGFVRSTAYEKKFDFLLISILSQLINIDNLDALLALHRFESLKFLLVEQKKVNTNDSYIKALFASNKYLPKGGYKLEVSIMRIRPLWLSAYILRYVILFKRKFNIK